MTEGPLSDPETQRVRALGGRWIVPAGARVHWLLAWLLRLCGQLRAAAAAGVTKVHSPQPGQCFFVKRNSIILEFYFSIPLKSEGFQDPQHLIGDAGNYPVTVEVLDTEKPTAGHRPGAEIAADGGQQRAEMQRSGGRRGEAAARAGRIGGRGGRGQAGDRLGSQRYQSSRSPYCFSRRSRRSWASMHSVATGRASRRFTPIGSPVSMQ